MIFHQGLHWLLNGSKRALGYRRLFHAIIVSYYGVPVSVSFQRVRGERQAGARHGRSSSAIGWELRACCRDSQLWSEQPGGSSSQMGSRSCRPEGHPTTQRSIALHMKQLNTTVSLGKGLRCKTLKWFFWNQLIETYYINIFLLGLLVADLHLSLIRVSKTVKPEVLKYVINSRRDKRLKSRLFNCPVKKHYL